MYLKQTLPFRCLFLVLLLGVTRAINAQECPPLPKHGFQIDYHSRLFDHKQQLFQITDFDTSINSINKASAMAAEIELKKSYNQLLWKVIPLPCAPNDTLENKIFLFQTCEHLNDSLSLRTTIHGNQTAEKRTGDSVVSVVYGNNFQREIIKAGQNDSIQLSNWYLKRFSSHEIKELSQKRKTYSNEMDKLYVQFTGSKTYHNWSTPEMNQLDSLEKLIDSIDYLLYPTLSLELNSWNMMTNTAFGIVPNQTLRMIQSANDPFLNQEFSLHHGYVDNPYKSKAYFIGDSTMLNGNQLYEAKEWKFEYSPWKEPRIVYWIAEEKYLIIQKHETNIGETYWDNKFTYYFYEMMD